MRMEGFLLKALNCPPNKEILLRIMKEKFSLSDFKVLSLELPIVQEEDYGFIDLFGLNESAGDAKYVFVETKWDFPGAKKQAEDDLRDYYCGYSKNGLFSDDMSRLYHETIFEENRHIYDPKIGTLFLPLVLSNSLVENASRQKLENVLFDFAKFTGERICKRIPRLERSIHALLDERLVPRYPNIVVSDRGNIIVVYCYDFNGDSVTREIPLSVCELLDQVPSREGLELNNNQLLDLLSKESGAKAFAIHYNLNGYHRPNLFLEIDSGKYVCFQHIGLGGLNYMGIYDKKAAIDCYDSMIYSTVLVDMGEYWITQAGKQTLVTQLTGRRFQGRLRMSFGASISFVTRFTSETSQTTLTRF